jgi:hypothetical protein
MASRELTNGFANRFLIFWAERTKMLAFPESTPQREVQALARKVAEVLRFAGASRWVDKDVVRVTLSPEARNRYERLYFTELNDNSAGAPITALIERRAPMLLRLAMLFALCDMTHSVEVQHIDAALAWVRYSVDSVKFIFGSAEAEIETAETNDTAQKILDYLAVQKRVTRSQLTTDCFKGHATKARIDAALDELLTCNPPSIEVHEDRAGKGRPSKFYELAAKYAKEAKKAKNQALTSENSCEVSCEVSAKEVLTHHGRDLLRNTSHTSHGTENAVLPSVGGLTSHTSHTSQAFSEKERTPAEARDIGLEALRRAWEATGRQMDSEGGNFAFIPKAAIVQEFEREGLPEKATTNNLAQGQYISTRKEGWVMSQPKELARWGVAHPNAGDDDAIEVTF